MSECTDPIRYLQAKNSTAKNIDGIMGTNLFLVNDPSIHFIYSYIPVGVMLVDY